MNPSETRDLAKVLESLGDRLGGASGGATEEPPAQSHRCSGPAHFHAETGTLQ